MRGYSLRATIATQGRPSRGASLRWRSGIHRKDAAIERVSIRKAGDGIHGLGGRTNFRSAQSQMDRIRHRQKSVEWSVPAERMKSDEPHNVPLADRCLEILAE